MHTGCAHIQWSETIFCWLHKSKEILCDIFEVPQLCPTVLPFLPNSTVEQPKRSQQNRPWPPWSPCPYSQFMDVILIELCKPRHDGFRFSWSLPFQMASSSALCPRTVPDTTGPSTRASRVTSCRRQSSSRSSTPVSTERGRSPSSPSPDQGRNSLKAAVTSHNWSPRNRNWHSKRNVFNPFWLL